MLVLLWLGYLGISSCSWSVSITPIPLMLQPFSPLFPFLLSSWLSLWGKYLIGRSLSLLLQDERIIYAFFPFSMCWCRTERLNLFKLEGQAKVGGTLVCVAGAVLMVLFRGPALFGETEVEFLGHGEIRHPEASGSGHLVSSFLSGIGRWNLGVLCLIGNCTCMAAFLAIQACVLLLPDRSKHPLFQNILLSLDMKIWSGSSPKEVSGKSFSDRILVFLWDHVHGDISFFHDQWVNQLESHTIRILCSCLRSKFLTLYMFDL